MSKKAKVYHAIIKGRKTGIFKGHFDHDGIRPLVDKHSANDYEGFFTQEDAEKWYKERTGGQFPDPKYTESFEISVSEFPIEKIQLQYLELETPPEVKRPQPKQSKNAEYQAVGVSSQDIGRWGEDFAVKALLAKFKKKYIDDYPQLSGERLNDGYARVTNEEDLFVGIHWCNSDQESSDSPDILVIENGIKTYWEVKSTRTGDRTNFTVTPHERDFAKEKGDKFWMLRVCYAGSLKARAYEIPNPYLTQDTILPMPSDKQQSVSQELQPVSGLKNPDDKYYNGFGRYIDDKGKIRSTAWVRLIPNGTGSIFISRKVGRKYKYAFSQVDSLENNYYRAFELLRSAKISDKFNVQIFLKGGYPSDQIKAIQSGLEQALKI